MINLTKTIVVDDEAIKNYIERKYSGLSSENKKLVFTWTCNLFLEHESEYKVEAVEYYVERVISKNFGPDEY